MLRPMQHRFIGSSKTMSDDLTLRDLHVRVKALEQNLDLSVTTISILVTQCKQASLIIEGLSSNQLSQQAQIQELGYAIDVMAETLGLIPENFQSEDDDTWN